MRIVVASPSGAGIATALNGMPDGSAVTVVSLTRVDLPGVDCIVVPPPSRLARRLDGWARRTAAGRALRRLTPLDPGAAFWRATRRSAAARESIRQAALLVAAERDATYAVWRWARVRRRGGDPFGAVFGFPAARAFVQRAPVA
jgi:hypothetical protein